MSLIIEKAASIQFDRLGSGGGLLRCDYRRLADASGGMIGTLFVFTDASASADLLTGFRHCDEFRDEPLSFRPSDDGGHV